MLPIINNLYRVKTSDQLALAARAFALLHWLLHAVALLLLDHRPHRLLEHFPQALSRQRAALEVLASHLVLDQRLGGLAGDRGRLGVLGALGLALPEVSLVADEDLDCSRHDGLDFRVPLSVGSFYLFASIGERGGLDDRKGDEEDISARIGKRPQPAELFLTGSIPQAQVDDLVVDLEGGREVIKDRGLVLLGKLVLRIAG